MSDPIAVHVRASDAILEAGVAAELGGRPEVVLAAGEDDAAVVVVVADAVDAETLPTIARLHEAGHRVVLVVAQLDDAQLLAAIEAGVQSILRRCEARGEAMVAAVRAASAGSGSIPPDLLG